MAQRRSGLGRGLDALLSDAAPERATRSDLAHGEGGAAALPTTLPVAALEPNPQQPRSDFDDAALAELSQSIRAQGVIQPIVVKPGKQAQRYTIVAGERRWRAARQAGLEAVPVRVLEESLDDSTVLQLALVENLQRSDLNAVEEASAYRELRERFDLSQSQIAEQVGKSRSAVANQIRLLRLPETVLDLLRTGELTAGQARPLLSLPQAEDQSALATRALRESLSARDIEALVKARLGGDGEEQTRGKKTAHEASQVDVHTRKASERLTRALQTRVEIRRGRRGGQVRIYFHSEEELMRVYELLAHHQEKTSVQE